MVTLATKIYVKGDARDRAIRSLDSIISNDIGQLNVSYDISFTPQHFPEISIHGEDEVAATSILIETWGEILPPVKNGSEYIGTLSSWDDQGFLLDSLEPVRIPSNNLGLGPGTPAQIRQRFGLVQHMPLTFIQGEPASLSKKELDRLYSWRRGLGRVNVNSATKSEVRATVNKSGHAKDIVSVERVGLLEQSIICSAGTDPPGILAAIGPYLPSEMKCVIPL
jgi:hypothetical protein|tara:strand:+ start:5267 stop:5935 length:669 start_codon:yes stop_codon:yes gene_type:complete